MFLKWGPSEKQLAAAMSSVLASGRLQAPTIVSKTVASTKTALPPALAPGADLHMSWWKCSISGVNLSISLLCINLNKKVLHVPEDFFIWAAWQRMSHTKHFRVLSGTKGTASQRFFSSGSIGKSFSFEATNAAAELLCSRACIFQGLTHVRWEIQGRGKQEKMYRQDWGLHGCDGLIVWALSPAQHN